MTYNSFSATPKSFRSSDFGRHIKYMSFIPAQNFSSIDVDHKEISLKKKTDFKTEIETLDA
jgi:hypothetical protein